MSRGLVADNRTTKTFPMFRYQRNKFGKAKTNPNNSPRTKYINKAKDVSSLTNTLNQEYKLGARFPIQSFMPRRPRYERPRTPYIRRSLLWKGMPRWSKSIWNGGYTGVRRKFTYIIHYAQSYCDL